MDRRQPIVLEFLGPPGVGKSMVARELDSALRKQGYSTTNKIYNNSRIESSVHRNLDKFKYIFKSIVSDPADSIKRYRAIADSGQPERGEFWNLFLYSCFLEGVERTLRNSGGIHVLDQGAVQLCWAIQYSGTEDITPERILETYPTFDNHIIVFVSADPEALYERLQNRDHGRSRVEGGSVTESDVELIQKEMRELFNDAEDRKDLIGIQLSNNGTVEDAVDLLLRELRQRRIVGRTKPRGGH